MFEKTSKKWLQTNRFNIQKIQLIAKMLKYSVIMAEQNLCLFLFHGCYFFMETIGYRFVKIDTKIDRLQHPSPTLM